MFNDIVFKDPIEFKSREGLLLLLLFDYAKISIQTSQLENNR